MKTYLTPRTFVILILWQVLGIVGMIYPALWPIYIGIPCVLVVVLYMDRKTLTKPSAISIGLVSKPIMELAEEGRIEWNVFSHDKTLFAIPGWELLLPQTPSFSFYPARIHPAIEYDKTGAVVFVFRTTCRANRLSRQQTHPLHLRSCSLLQLWGRSFDFRGNKLFPSIVPTRQRVPEQTFERMMRNNRSLFTGARVRTRHGAPDQFHSHRPYRHGDPLRFIDHKKTARYGELITKTFDTLVDQTVIIGCDLGRSMSGKINGSDKLSFYREAIYHLIENAILSRDKVGFFGFAGDVTMMVPPTRDLSAFQPILDGDSRLQVFPEESEYSVIPKALSQLSGGRSVFILFSDLSRPSVQNALMPQINLISHHHLTMILGLIDTNYDIDEQILGLPADYSEKIHAELVYGYWLRTEFDLFNQNVSRTGAGVVTIPERYWMDMTSRIYQTLRNSVLAG